MRRLPKCSALADSPVACNMGSDPLWSPADERLSRDFIQTLGGSWGHRISRAFVPRGKRGKKAKGKVGEREEANLEGRKAGRREEGGRVKGEKG